MITAWLPPRSKRHMIAQSERSSIWVRPLKSYQNRDLFRKQGLPIRRIGYFNRTLSSKPRLFIQASPSLSTQPLFVMADPVTPRNKSIPREVPPTPAVGDANRKCWSKCWTSPSQHKASRNLLQLTINPTALLVKSISKYFQLWPLPLITFPTLLITIPS